MGKVSVTQALRAISFASHIYSSLPDAEVSPRVLTSPIYDTKWACQVDDGFWKRISPPTKLRHAGDSPTIDSWKNPKTDRVIKLRQSSLACVAYMESGIDLNPADLKRVFAFAFEDSIYVSMKVRGYSRKLPAPVAVSLAPVLISFSSI
jgi:hypothetical protein